MARLISLRAYARHRAELGMPGGSLSGVQKAIATGRITRINGKIDAEVADIQWAQKTDLDQQSRGASGGHPPRQVPQKNAAEPPPTPSGRMQGGAQERDGYFANKERRELAEAQLAELELREKTGELVRREDVARETFAMLRALRDRMISVPDRIAAQLAAESDPGKVHDILSAEIKGSLRRVTEVLSADT